MSEFFTFKTDLAKKYGVEEAVMLQNIIFWVEKNKANGKHFYDGKYWTYNSRRAFMEIFPFWNDNQIRRILGNLIKEKAIEKGNYNKKGYDQTSWFTLGEGLMHLIGEKSPMDWTKTTNGLDENHQPIPDNITYINQYKSPSDLFNALWELYPSKLGKAKVTDKTKAKLFDIGYDKLRKCIERYKETKPDWKAWQNGSTFFNSGYVDYLDENFSEAVNESAQKPKSKFKDFDRAELDAIKI